MNCYTSPQGTAAIKAEIEAKRERLKVLRAESKQRAVARAASNVDRAAMALVNKAALVDGISL